MDFLKRSCHFLHPVVAHHLQFQRAYVPLSAELLVLVFSCLLHCHIRQVDLGVVDVFDVGVLARVGEACESCSLEPHRKWALAGDQHLDASVEFLATHQQRIHDVPLHNLVLRSRVVCLVALVTLPLLDLRQLIKQENAFTLTLANRLHDLHTSRIPLEFLHKQ